MAPKLRPYDRNQIVAMDSDLDSLLPENHEARDLWEYICELNLDPLYDSIKSQKGASGGPRFDPKILLCLWLYAHAQGVGSARELEQLCHESLPYRWICADDPPNYHTLADFRMQQASKDKDFLNNLFTQILGVLVSEGLIDPEDMTVSHDGLRVRTSAGRGSFRRRASLEWSPPQKWLHME